MPKPAAVFKTVSDGGTIIYKSQTTKKLHRLDGPALLSASGQHEWYKDGKRHREKGPAVYNAIDTSDEEYLQYLHRVAEGEEREKLEAVPFPEQTDRIFSIYEEWYYEGVRHREDGPAVTGYGQEMWYYKGEKHREKGPAVLSSNGDETWYKHGVLHRIGGPAVTEKKQQKELWYKEGLLHRLDGPAKIYWDERNHRLVEQYYIDDTLYNRKADYNLAVRIYKGN